MVVVFYRELFHILRRAANSPDFGGFPDFYTLSVPTILFSKLRFFKKSDIKFFCIAL
jgi:hypothetical protein